MIKIYDLKKNSFFLLKDSFSRKYLKSKGIVPVNNPLQADVLISPSSYFKSYKVAKLMLPHKKYMIWCNEPRFDYTTEGFVNDKRIIMNVYSGDVFLHNLHFLGSYHSNFANNLGIDMYTMPGYPLTVERLARKQKFCVAIFSYQKPKSSKLMFDDQNIDLRMVRQRLALYMYQREKMDIVGGNWPVNVDVYESSGFDSGNMDWWTTKMDLLKNYRFNLCYENTIFPNYCTEKLWHAIASGCLPIYYGKGTSIYKTFPQDSFIDGSKFESNKALFDFLENITPEEHVARYNTCLEVMHQSLAKRVQDPTLKTEVQDRFIHNIYQLVNRPTAVVPALTNGILSPPITLS